MVKSNWVNVYFFQRKKKNAEIVWKCELLYRIFAI